MYKHIVFEGTSIKGLSYCGVIDVLEKHSILSSLTHFAGVSSGCIFAVMLALGYTAQEIKNFFSIERISGIIPNHCKLYLLYSLWRKMGMYEQVLVRKELIQLIELKYPSSLTFGELYSQTGRVLVIGVTEITSYSPVYLNPFTTPDVSILDAILASICLPLFFIPTKYNFTGEDKIYIDGGISNNFPVNIFNDIDYLITNKTINQYKTLSLQTLGIEVSINKSNQTATITGLQDYLKAIIKTLLEGFENSENKNPSNIIKIHLNKNTSSFEFDLKESERQELIDSGARAAEEFLHNVRNISHENNNVDE